MNAGTTLNYLRKVIYTDRTVGAAIAKGLDEASGGAVSRHVLRPDIFGPGPDAAASPGPRVERAVMPVADERVVKSPHVRSRGPRTNAAHGLARAEEEEGRASA